MIREASGRIVKRAAHTLYVPCDCLGADSRGYDAGKKTNGRKRHPVVDTAGMLIAVIVTAASMKVLAKARMEMPSIVQVWADSGYAGKLVEFARQKLQLTLDIVKKPQGQHTFETLQRRWVVEDDMVMDGAFPPPRPRR